MQHEAIEAAVAPGVKRTGRWWRKRALWCPTWRIWLAGVMLLFGAVYVTRAWLHDWLAVREPVSTARYVVIEGWAPDYVVEEARVWAEAHETRLVFTTGIPLDRGALLSDYKTYAQAAAVTLAKLGYEPGKICPVPAVEIKTERTRAMAEALKQELSAQNVAPEDKKLNIFTLGTHGRRSRRIFQSVLGPEWQIGIVSVPSRNYDAAVWYRQSDGAKTVVNELVALSVQLAGGG